MADVFLKDVLPVSGEVGDLKVGGSVTLEYFDVYVACDSEGSKWKWVKG